MALTLGNVIKSLDITVARSFMEVANIYKYGEDELIGDYLDFVLHEPIEWLRGFPKKWTTEADYHKVRTGFRKILKLQSVIDALGKDKCESMSREIWDIFKHISEMLPMSDIVTSASIDVPKISSDTSKPINSTDEIKDLKRILATVVEAYKTLLSDDDKGKSAAILLAALTNQYLK